MEELSSKFRILANISEKLPIIKTNFSYGGIKNPPPLKGGG